MFNWMEHNSVQLTWRWFSCFTWWQFMFWQESTESPLYIYIWVHGIFRIRIFCVKKTSAIRTSKIRTITPSWWPREEGVGCRGGCRMTSLNDFYRYLENVFTDNAQGFCWLVVFEINPTENSEWNFFKGLWMSKIVCKREGWK